MKYNKLGDYYKISSGGTPSKNKPEYYENGTIPWVKTGDLKEKYVTGQVKMISELGLKNSSARVYPKGTVLLAMYGATIGACSILSTEASCNQACAAFVPNDKILPEYLYIYLCSQKNKFVDSGVGGAQPNISAGFLKTVNFQLETLEKQRRVVEIFDSLDTLVSMHKKQIDKIDFLVKSRFIELFGDPIRNPYGYDKVALEELADIKIGPFGSLLHKEDYIEGGHPVINPSHIHDGSIIPDYQLTISDEKYKELETYRLFKDDVVLGRRGEMGRCAVVNEDGLLCGTGSLLIRPREYVTADFIQKVISFPTFKKSIEDMAVGQTMPNLNVPIVSQFQVIRPSLDIQNKYYDFVAQVDKSKLAVLQSLKELETLKKSLMQQYFG